MIDLDELTDEQLNDLGTHPIALANARAITHLSGYDSAMLYSLAQLGTDPAFSTPTWILTQMCEQLGTLGAALGALDFGKSHQIVSSKQRVDELGSRKAAVEEQYTNALVVTARLSAWAACMLLHLSNAQASMGAHMDKEDAKGDENVSGG
jgi:hypothetical protein